MSSKHSRALSRLEDHNTAQTGSKSEHFIDDSQRKSKKTEKSNRPPMDENVSVSHHSKRSKEKSPSKQRSADLQGVNAYVRSLLGLGLVASCDRHSTLSESAV